MTDSDFPTDLTPLGPDELQQFRDLVTALRNTTEPWGNLRPQLNTSPGHTQVSFMVMSDLAGRAMDWFYRSGRLYPFDWGAWDEGREITRTWTVDTPAILDHLTTRKLITAIARNDRFCEGAWMNMFERGHGVRLFERLLEHEEALTSS